MIYLLPLSLKLWHGWYLWIFVWHHSIITNNWECSWMKRRMESKLVTAHRTFNFPQRWQDVQSQLKFLVLLSTNYFQTYTPQDPRTYSFICHKIWQICHFHSLCNVSQRCLSSQYQKLIFIKLCNFSFSSRPQKEPISHVQSINILIACNRVQIFGHITTAHFAIWEWVN